LWHYPVILFADYKSDTPVWFYLPILTLTIPLMNFVWTWMRLKTGSIWPGVVLHAAHNTFIQSFFDPLTVHNKRTNYVASEFGTALLVLSLLLAIYFWNRRSELEGVPTAKADV
jgi:membrane protease YdiL (CAAX protease family)